MNNSIFDTPILPVAESDLKMIYASATKASPKVNTKGILVVVDTKTGTIRVLAIGQMEKE